MDSSSVCERIIESPFEKHSLTFRQHVYGLQTLI